MVGKFKGLKSLNNSTRNASIPSGIFPARVRFTILDNKTNPQIFKEYGEWSSIGCIFFQQINNPNPSPNFSSDNFAQPLYSNNKIYPLENEVVYVIALPNNNIQGNVNDISYYYFQPINIWNSTHHNAIPDPINNNSIPPSQTQDYQQTEAGAVRRVTDGGTEIDLGDTFREKLNIKSLQPFEGDIIYEGRWGQSIRFGSTVTNGPIANPWSNTGENGDPILILKNGQHEDGNDPWIPQIENINKDQSSIYLTSTQIIPIDVASKSYKSYSSAPISPNEFNKEQIILNSGRLLFNSKNDSILLSSFKTINLNAQESVNVDTKKFIVDASEIYLGGKDATESVILGDKFLNDFSRLLTQLISLCSSLPSVGTPTPYVPNIDVATKSIQLQTTAQSMLNKIESFKSKISKTL